MKVSTFDFELPAERIALRPARPRDSARLMVVRRGGIEDKGVRDLPKLLKAGDCLVFNDTKVLPVRLVGRIGQGKAEATLLKPLGKSLWTALVKPGKKFRVGVAVDFKGLKATVVAKGDGGEVTLKFDPKKLRKHIEKHGLMPLPPYIASRRAPDRQDRADYQTAYARKAGAVAAPTAGLHFTKRLFKALEKRGVKTAFVTLHVGAGTFLPVKAADTRDHKMHSERAEVSASAAKAINAARAKGGRVVAVGTTSLRLLETAAGANGKVRPWAGETGIFITPGYRFKAADLLLTNFHLPRSTLFMLVAAFSGLTRMKKAYRHAVASGYRFFSYGDACLLFPGRER
jgi:S-adenosylmethionine:tRNA ribosyltransferase-isomerase